MPRILPLVGIAIGGVLAVNALSGARDLPGLISGAQAFAEEATKAVKPGKDADVRAFETEMTDAIGMRVRVTVGPDGRGQVVITVENWLQIEDLKARLTIQ